MPPTKPRRCREKAWEQLQDYYHGVICPGSEVPLIGGVGAPEYLSIAGHENCLDENQEDGFTSSCIPAVKPSNCEVQITIQFTFHFSQSLYFILSKALILKYFIPTG